MSQYSHALIAFLLSAMLPLLLSALAARVGLVDHPGGRKHHEIVVPLIGGISIFIAVLATNIFTGSVNAYHWIFIATSLVVIVGVLDDRHEVRPKIKLLVQAIAALAMVFGGNVALHVVGNLLGFGLIGLSIFVYPLTLFAALGVVNAINMMDGIDGLAGSVSAVAIAAYAYVAYASGLDLQLDFLLVLLGAVLGFLLHNLRFPWQRHARIFLGDAGSLLLGFLLAWFAIDLTQGDGRSFPPICALWVIVIPLCDCVSLMLRRIKKGNSPFSADRQHLHHYLRTRGLNVPQSQWAITAACVLCALVGVLGWKFAVPEPLLFAAFVVFFVVYHVAMSRNFKNYDAANELGPTTTEWGS